MIEEIITFLRKNTEYIYIFNATQGIEDCIVYLYQDTSNNKIIRQSKLELHLIAVGMKESAVLRLEEMTETINDILLTKADRQFSKKIINIEQNGGGMLVDYATQTTHKILYYDIILKNNP